GRRALAVDAQDLALLRLIHEMEERAERLEHPAQRRIVQLANQGLGFASRGIIGLLERLPAQQPQPLHQVQALPARLLLDHLTEQRTEQVDVLAERFRYACA